MAFPQFFRVSALPTQPFAPAFPGVLTSLPAGLTLPVQDLMTVSPDFATLYSYNANFSFSRELRRDFVASASFLYTKGTRLPVYRNINLMPSGLFLRMAVRSSVRLPASTRLQQHPFRGVGRQLELQRAELDC